MQKYKRTGTHTFVTNVGTNPKFTKPQFTRAKHEGVRYGCDQCDYKATLKENVTIPMQAIHGCDNSPNPCYQFT